MKPAEQSIPVYAGPIVVTPATSHPIVDVPWSFSGTAIASADARGEVDVLGFLPGYGDTGPTHLLTFRGGETIVFPPAPQLSPAMPYLIVERLDSGTVTLYLPEPSGPTGLLLFVAAAMAVVLRWRFAR